MGLEKVLLEVQLHCKEQEYLKWGLLSKAQSRA